MLNLLSSNTIPSILEYVEREFCKAKVECIYLVGSHALCGKNPHDIDLVVVVDFDYWHMVTKKISGCDVFIYPKDLWLKMATAQETNYSPSVGLLSAHPEYIFYGELPIKNYNWFDYQEEALKREQEYQERFLRKGVPSKRRRLGVFLDYVVKNQSFVLTEEQREHLSQTVFE